MNGIKTFFIHLFPLKIHKAINGKVGKMHYIKSQKKYKQQREKRGEGRIETVLHNRNRCTTSFAQLPYISMEFVPEEF